MSHDEDTTTEESGETQDEERIKNNFREISRRITCLFETKSWLERVGCLPLEFEVGTIEHFLKLMGEQECMGTERIFENVQRSSGGGEIIPERSIDGSGCKDRSVGTPIGSEEKK